MTRINVINPRMLTDKHLGAEWYELPRVFTLVAKQVAKGVSPERYIEFDEYRLGTGHLCFFFTRLHWLRQRHRRLFDEQRRRKRRPDIRKSTLVWVKAAYLPATWSGEWTPDRAAVRINLERLVSKDPKAYQGLWKQFNRGTKLDWT